MPLVWRELFTRASLGRSGASKQLAPLGWPHLGRIIFSKNIIRYFVALYSQEENFQ